MEHSTDKKKELIIKIAFCEKNARKEMKDAKTLLPGLKKAIAKAKQLETYWNAHQISKQEWLKKRDEFLGQLALLTNDPSIINNAQSKQDEGIEV